LRGLKTYLILIFILLCFSTQLSGQFYFGKNKVNYEVFNWNVLETEHFKIYFYDEEDWLAKIAAHYIEESYDFLADRFNHHIFKKTPFIIYSLPNFFTQTNIVPQILPESVAGFTEFFKGRMVVPYDGSLYEFLRVVQHELVHVFTYSKLEKVLRDHRKFNLYGPPLWFTEGIAEYWSRPWSTEADMMIADLMISGNFIDYNNIYVINNTFLMYKVGESMCKYLSETYGEEKLLLLLENWWKGKNFEKVVEYTFGKTLKSIFKDWQYSLKKRYFPTMAEWDYPGKFATRQSGKGFYVKPILVENHSDTGTIQEFVCKANQLGYSGLYRKPLNRTKHKENVVLKGERSSDFESLYLLRSSISANQLNELVFASRSYDRDALYILDLKTNKIMRTEKFDNIVSIVSPAFSRDGSLVAFAGAERNGQFDLYVFDVNRSELTRLTHDFYYDQGPAFSPDNRI